MKLRQISSIDLSFANGGEGELGELDFTQTTDEMVAEAFQAYKKWWDEINESQMNTEEKDAAHEIIWDLVRAYQQYAHEAGLRLGIRLVCESMATPVPLPPA